jgi:hypothetical protein
MDGDSNLVEIVLCFGAEEVSKKKRDKTKKETKYRSLFIGTPKGEDKPSYNNNINLDSLQ